MLRTIGIAAALVVGVAHRLLFSRLAFTVLLNVSLTLIILSRCSS